MANFKTAPSIGVYIGFGMVVLYGFYLAFKDLKKKDTPIHVSSDQFTNNISPSLKSSFGGGSAVTKKGHRRHKRNKQTKVKCKM